MTQALIGGNQQNIHITNPLTHHQSTFLHSQNYKVVFKQNALILLHMNDTAPKPYDRSLQLGGLMRSQLHLHRQEILRRLAVVKNIVGLGLTIERLIGIPMALSLSDLENILKEQN